MPSERIQRRIERLLDETEQALDEQNWELAANLARQVLLLDPDNVDAAMLLTSAEGMRAPSNNSPGSPGASPAPEQQPDVGSAGARHAWPLQTPSAASAPEPSSFANGRYQVKKFLGEGGKKRVYLAHGSLLVRDVAFALIKTEWLDDAGRQRVQREAQAMGRLGSHPRIVSVFDLGTEPPPLDSGSPLILVSWLVRQSCLI